MRLIQLMHTEYQINNKLVGKKVLANDEMCNNVAEEQHDSRKHHQAGLLVLDRELVGDLFRYTHQFGCYGMNDAKGGFDWIQPCFCCIGIDVLQSCLVCSYYIVSSTLVGTPQD